MEAGTTIRVRGEGGSEWDQDVPENGTVQRELLEDMVAKGRLQVLDDPADDPAERPAVRASKDEWVAYVVAAGLADEAEARTMSKAELQRLAEPSEEDVDPSEGGPDVGADALVDEEGTEPEQVIDGPAVSDRAAQQLDGDDDVIGQGTDGS